MAAMKEETLAEAVRQFPVIFDKTEKRAQRKGHSGKCMARSGERCRISVGCQMFDKLNKDTAKNAKTFGKPTILAHLLPMKKRL